MIGELLSPKSESNLTGASRRLQASEEVGNNVAPLGPVVLMHEIHELGIDPAFWPRKASQGHASEASMVVLVHNPLGLI
jgi:hypothetical protein